MTTPADVMPRAVVWFSRGAASAVAAKLAVAKYENCEVVYCDTSADEHPDGPRFAADVEKWIGKPITVIAGKYKTVDEVNEATRYMSGPQGARCTVELKKAPRFEYQRPDDIQVFGLTYDEATRAADFRSRNHELILGFILIENSITKDDCLRMIAEAGIRIPTMYALGYEHNNCIGCVKASSPKYWNNIRRDFPEQFEVRAKRSRELGVRLAKLRGRRIFLDELPPTASEHIFENLSCGPQCV